MLEITRPDWLVRWFMKRFVYTLTKGGWTFVWKSRLTEKDRKTGKRCILRGLTDFDGEKHIYLNPSFAQHPTRNLLLRTMVHELGHVLFSDHDGNTTGHVPHYAIYSFERLADSLTPEQEEILLAFLPRHRNRKHWRKH
jgi:hypothetical protein